MLKIVCFGGRIVSLAERYSPSVLLNILAYLIKLVAKIVRKSIDCNINDKKELVIKNILQDVQTKKTGRLPCPPYY